MNSRKPTRDASHAKPGKEPEVRPEYLKAKDAGRMIGVGARTIFNWAAAGKLRACKVTARTVLFRTSEVLALVEQARV